MLDVFVARLKKVGELLRSVLLRLSLQIVEGEPVGSVSFSVGIRLRDRVVEDVPQVGATT